MPYQQPKTAPLHLPVQGWHTPLTPGLLLSAHVLLPATGLVEEVEAVWDEVEAELEGAGGVV